MLNTVDTKKEYMERVQEGFKAVLNSPGGYGVGYMDKSMKPAGKTGTSQSFIDTDNNKYVSRLLAQYKYSNIKTNKCFQIIKRRETTIILYVQNVKRSIL